MQSSIRYLVPLFVVFLFFLILPIALSDTLQRYNTDKNVILFANALFFIISIVSFYIQKRGMQYKNPHAFVRSVTGSMMIKMLVCIAGVVIYIYYSGDSFNKRAVLFSLFLYLVYLFTEVMVVMKMNKKQHA